MKIKKIIIFLLIFQIFISCSQKHDIGNNSKKEIKIAYVLGGGAFRGYSHIGVLKTLETMPEFVVKNKLNYSMIDTIEYKNANFSDIIDKVYGLIHELNKILVDNTVSN